MLNTAAWAPRGDGSGAESVAVLADHGTMPGTSELLLAPASGDSSGPQWTGTDTAIKG